MIGRLRYYYNLFAVLSAYGEKVEVTKMPRKQSSNTSNENKNKKPDFEELKSFEVIRARELTYNGKTSVLADLKLNGVWVYGARAVTYKDKSTGEEKDFIGWPEREGKDKDGNKAYYKVAYMALSAEDQQTVCNAIYDKLDNN